MSGFSNTKADTAFLKKRFNQNLAAGEKLIGSEYWVTVKGDVFAAVRQMVLNKEYVDITFAAAAESNGGDSAGLTRSYLHCKVYSDSVDFGSEDTTAAVKLPLRVVYNWAE